MILEPLIGKCCKVKLPGLGLNTWRIANLMGFEGQGDSAFKFIPWASRKGECVQRVKRIRFE
jgi:hypothetical protein